jgi:hypothetical protein
MKMGTMYVNMKMVLLYHTVKKDVPSIKTHVKGMAMLKLIIAKKCGSAISEMEELLRM